MAGAELRGALRTRRNADLSNSACLGQTVFFSPSELRGTHVVREGFITVSPACKVAIQSQVGLNGGLQEVPPDSNSLPGR